MLQWVIQAVMPSADHAGSVGTCEGFLCAKEPCEQVLIDDFKPLVKAKSFEEQVFETGAVRIEGR